MTGIDLDRDSHKHIVHTVLKEYFKDGPDTDIVLSLITSASKKIEEYEQCLNDERTARIKAHGIYPGYGDDLPF